MTVTLLPRLFRLAPLGALFALAACGAGSSPRPAMAPPPAVPVASGDVDMVQAQLMHGDRRAAEKALKPLLKRDPMNSRLLLLRDSMQRDPQELLGPTHYAYVVRDGETFESIADRLLGNRLKAYQLARYNGMENPSSLAAGSTIRIPGSPPAPKPAPVADRPSRPAASAVSAKPKPTPPAPVARPVANPAAARTARAAGLAALNRGAVNEAVLQLRRAQALDPGNAVIARDLQRAERISATVKTRK